MEETLARTAVTLQTERIKGPILDVYDDGCVVMMT